MREVDPGIARAAHGRGQQDREQHDADPVIEQRLAGHIHFQGLGDPRLLQYGEHGDGVGGADQRADHDRPGEGDGQTEELAGPQNRIATTMVEITTPSVAMVPTAHARSRNSDRSICRAPANSRKASMPSSSVSEKLIFSTKSSRSPKSATSGMRISRATKTSEAAMPMSSRPTLFGSRK